MTSCGKYCSPVNFCYPSRSASANFLYSFYFLVLYMKTISSSPSANFLLNKWSHSLKVRIERVCFYVNISIFVVSFSWVIFILIFKIDIFIGRLSAIISFYGIILIKLLFLGKSLRTWRLFISSTNIFTAHFFMMIFLVVSSA